MVCVRVRYLIIFLCMLCSSSVLAQTDEERAINALLKQVEAADIDTLKAKLYVKLIELSANNYLKAGEYALKAVEHAEKTQDTWVKYLSYAYAGEVFLNTGNMDIAVDFFTRYIDLAMAEQDTVDLAIGYFNLGSTWLAMEEYEKAEKMMRKMESIALDFTSRRKEPLDKSNLMTVYVNMIIVKADQQDWQGGKAYFEKGMALATEIAENDFWVGMLCTNYADMLLKQGNFEQALQQYSQAREKFVVSDDASREAMALKGVGDVFMKKNQPQQAQQLYRQAMQLGLQTQNDWLVHDLADALYKLFKTTAQADSSLKYLSMAEAYEKKLQADKAKEMLITKELSWQFAEMQRQRESAYSRNIRWVLGGLGVLALLTMGIMYVAGRKHRKLQQANLEKYQLALNARQLELDKELLQAQVELKDKQLATEVLHRVQNHELVKEVVQKLIAVHARSTKETKETLGSVLKGLERSLEDKAWQDFELRFQQVHPAFYEKLQRDFPDLSLNERRLCAFLKLNMTTKEISAITGQSLNSIQVARWRMRKKLNLQDAEEALTDFFSKY